MININFGEAFKSLGAFITKNWQALGLVIMVILFFVTKNDYGALKKSMEVMNNSYEEQIAALQLLHEEELKKREDAIANYEEELEDLTQRFNDELEDLRRTKEEDVEEYMRDFAVQPEKLALEIEEQFGFTYVE